MKLKPVFFMAIAALWIAGCSSLPGLRVLSGQEPDPNNVNRVVEELDLVMADKTGATDPSLLSAADRIEAAASGEVDIIEIRPDSESDTFIVNMLYSPPQVPQSLEGQIMALESRRRALELTWQGVLQESEGSDILHVSLVFPRPITTLDSGNSFVGYVIVDSIIGREDVAQYLSGERNLNAFYELILNGTLTYAAPEQISLYEGRPNHPMFMLARFQPA